jgi:hypothetical protein
MISAGLITDELHIEDVIRHQKPRGTMESLFDEKHG